jgi:hypothetical protein
MLNLGGFIVVPIGGTHLGAGAYPIPHRNPPPPPIVITPIGGGNQTGANPDPVPTRTPLPPPGVVGIDLTPIGGTHTGAGAYPVPHRNPPPPPIVITPIGGGDQKGANPAPVPTRTPPPPPNASLDVNGFGVTPIGGTHQGAGAYPVPHRNPPPPPIVITPIGGGNQTGANPDPVPTRTPPPPSGVIGIDVTPIGGTHTGAGAYPVPHRNPPLPPIVITPIGGGDQKGANPDPAPRRLPSPPAGMSFDASGFDTSPIGGAIGIDRRFPTEAGLFAFAPAVQIGVGSHPQGTAVADLNGDGQAEIAVTCTNPDRVAIFRNFGDGQFARPIDVLLPNGSGPDQIVAGDFNGDGRIDLAVTLKNFDAVALLTNDREFAVPPKLFNVGVAPRFLAAADLDGDGHLDLVVSNGGSGSLTFLFNDGFGNFKAQDIGVGPDPRAVAAADFDGDSWIDVAVSVGGSRTVELLKNYGGRTFKTWQSFSTGRLVPDGLVAADLEGDGDVDICVTASGDESARMLSFLNSGHGHFDAGPVALMDGYGNSAVAAADFDLDHNLDLACVAASDPIVSVWHNQGMARFATYSEFGAGRGPMQVVAADLDGNGSPDLVVTNRDSDSITILMNLASAKVGIGFCFGDGSGTPCPARNNGDAGHGCNNAAGTGGALLTTTGAARLANDTLVLKAENLPRSAWLAFFEGSSAVGRGYGIPFSHGLACIDGPMTLLGVRSSMVGTATYPAAGEMKLSLIGELPPAGGTRYYQVWYRDNAPPMIYQAYNLSNGVSVTWIP